MTSQERNTLKVAISEGLDATIRSLTRARNHVHRALGEEEMLIDWSDDETGMYSTRFLDAVTALRAERDFEDIPTPATASK